MYESFSIENILYSTHTIVSSERESLAEFVQRVRAEKKLSLNDVRTQSGFQIANSYLNRIENGEVTNVSLEKLRALAKGLGADEDEVIALAQGKTLVPMSPKDFESALEALGVEHLQAYGGVENLTDEDRAEVVAMLQTMIVEKLKRKPKAKPSAKGAKNTK